MSIDKGQPRCHEFAAQYWKLLQMESKRLWNLQKFSKSQITINDEMRQQLRSFFTFSCGKPELNSITNKLPVPDCYELQLCKKIFFVFKIKFMVVKKRLFIKKVCYLNFTILSIIILDFLEPLEQQSGSRYLLSAESKKRFSFKKWEIIIESNKYGL